MLHYLKTTWYQRRCRIDVYTLLFYRVYLLGVYKEDRASHYTTDIWHYENLYMALINPLSVCGKLSADTIP